jgi:hypothetical protein
MTDPKSTTGSKKSNLTLAIVAVCVLAGMAKCSGGSNSTDTSSADTGSETASAAPVDPKTKIADYAVDDLTPDQYPKIYKKLGKKGVKDAKAGAFAAAYRVAQSPECDQVETASITMESTKTNQKFFVNCTNAKQWHFTASELKDSAGHWYTAENAPVVGMSDTDRRKQELENLQKTAPGGVMECEDLLKARLKHPASAEFHTVMGMANFINSSDERAIQIEFESTNAFNATLSYTGQCVFHKNGKVSVDIFDR